MSRVTLAGLNSCDRATFVAALGHLFEHSPWVADEAFVGRPYRDPEHLHAGLCAAVGGADAARQLALIRAHPDLATRLQGLTAASAREQAGAGLDRLTGAEAAEFRELNDAYRTRFGFPFVICARLNARDAILAAMRERLKNGPGEERAAALGEIEKIAWLRLQELV
jgi:OHCU decarboxylase